jgi:hypothetical protein
VIVGWWNRIRESEGNSDLWLVEEPANAIAGGLTFGGGVGA